jgi:hypothetical protein
MSKTYARSFAGGEIASELIGRLDLTKNQTGVARALNFIILPHGPAANRPGWEHVIETKDSSKVSVQIPFIYSTSQSYTLEFGDQYMRIHTDGGTLLNTSQSVTSISKANPGVVGKVAHGYANGQWLYLLTAGMTELHGRFVKVAGAAADTFNLTDLAGSNINTTGYGTFTSGTMASVFEITTPYLAADLYDLHYAQSADVLTLTCCAYQQRELRRTAATTWPLATFTLVPTIATPAAPTVAATVAVGADTDYRYKTSAVASDGLEESLGSAASVVVSNKLVTSGNYNTITPAVVAGAVRYNVYKFLNGLYGYIAQTDGSPVKDDNITPDFTQTPAIAEDPFVGADNYPGGVGYHRGRRWFAGTNAKPQNLWGTRSGTESNLAYSIPTRDDDRIAVRLTARQANKILHIVPLTDLLLLTSGAEWLIKTQNSDAITPASIDYAPQSYVGANNVQPIVTSKSVIYAQAQGGRIRELLASEFDTTKYACNDVSIMAPHLFDGFTIKSMAYTQAPYKTLWFVRSDGVLLGLTYVPEHEVVAWHQHNTDGTYEAVCSVPEGAENVLYATIKRTTNGRTVRSIERMHSRQFTRLQDAFFVDDGLTLENTIAATLTPGTGATEAETANVTFLASSAVFASTDVDRYIHYDYSTLDDEGQTVWARASALITSYVDTTRVKATIESAWPSVDVIASAGWRLTVTQVTNLWHLVGETVAVLADGAVFPQATVSAAGTITLEQPASVVHVGRPYNSDLKTLPLVAEMQAFGVGGMKNVGRLYVRVDKSSGLSAGPSFSKLKPFKQRTDEVYGTPPRPITGMMRVLLTPDWSADAAVCIRQSDPLPVTVVALVPDTSYGG